MPVSLSIYGYGFMIGLLIIGAVNLFRKGAHDDF